MPLTSEKKKYRASLRSACKEEAIRKLIEAHSVEFNKYLEEYLVKAEKMSGFTFKRST